MKICFIGSGNFALPILDYLSKNFDISLVVTRPDAKKGRGQKLVFSEVHELAQNIGIQTLTPDTINNLETLELIRGYGIDLGILASYSEILSPETIKAFKFGILNIHPSLLPKYRGAEPIRWPIRKGEKITGVTIIMLSEKLDRGNIIAQNEIPIEDFDDYGSLTKKLIELSIRILLDSIEKVKTGFIGVEQPQEKTFYARRMKPEDEKIDWTKTASQISLLVRSMSPNPCCYSTYNGKRLKLFMPIITDEKGQPGQVFLSKKSFSVACSDFSISFMEVHKEGGKRMLSKDFIASGFFNSKYKFC
jgi:methionyl-tRNA formyltransferase